MTLVRHKQQLCLTLSRAMCCTKMWLVGCHVMVEGVGDVLLDRRAGNVVHGEPAVTRDVGLQRKTQERDKNSAQAQEGKENDGTIDRVGEVRQKRITDTTGPAASVCAMCGRSDNCRHDRRTSEEENCDMTLPCASVGGPGGVDGPGYCCCGVPPAAKSRTRVGRSRGARPSSERA